MKKKEEKNFSKYNHYSLRSDFSQIPTEVRDCYNRNNISFTMEVYDYCDEHGIDSNRMEFLAGDITGMKHKETGYEMFLLKIKAKNENGDVLFKMFPLNEKDEFPCDLFYYKE